MTKETINLWKKEEYTYCRFGEFIPNLTAYLHEEAFVRPAVIVVPGGGYCVVAMGEGEPVAGKFYEMGYQVFVLTYTTRGLQQEPLEMQPMLDLNRAVVYVRSRSRQLNVAENGIAVCGFSAGGHLCASFSVHYGDTLLQAGNASDNRPDAQILCYPVITADGPWAHKESMYALSGNNLSGDKLYYWSAEKHVAVDTPPTFIWHTSTDETVPVENSLLMAQACWKQGISCELHIFPEGGHGYSVADEAWASGEYGDNYTMNQFFAQMQYFIDHEMELPAAFGGTLVPIGTDYRKLFCSQAKNYLVKAPNRQIALWPMLADQWLRSVFR